MILLIETVSIAYLWVFVCVCVLSTITTATASKYRIKKVYTSCGLKSLVTLCAKNQRRMKKEKKKRRKSEALKTIERVGQYFVYSLLPDACTGAATAVYLELNRVPSSCVQPILYRTNKETMSYWIFILYWMLKQLLAQKRAFFHDHRDGIQEDGFPNPHHSNLILPKHLPTQPRSLCVCLFHVAPVWKFIVSSFNQRRQQTHTHTGLVHINNRSGQNLYIYEHECHIWWEETASVGCRDREWESQSELQMKREPITMRHRSQDEMYNVI